MLNVVFSGLVAGLIATSVMSVPQYVFWRRWKTIGILEWHENQMIVARIFRIEPEKALLPSFSLHFLNGALAAISYAIILWLLPQLKVFNILFLGGLFGIILWVFTLALIHKPITGVSLLDHPLGSAPIILSITLHIIYGIVTALSVEFLL